MLLNSRKVTNFGFTLIELLVVISIIGLLSTVAMTSLNSARTKARDARRVQELKQVQYAIEQYYAQTGSYVTGMFFSAWDRSYSHTVYYWSGGNPPSVPALYNAIVGNGYMQSLPLDPVNKEANPNGAIGYYLADGPPFDLAYLYYSDNGQRYILGANLETGGSAPDRYGNYQLKGGNW